MAGADCRVGGGAGATELTEQPALQLDMELGRGLAEPPTTATDGFGIDEFAWRARHVSIGGSAASPRMLVRRGSRSGVNEAREARDAARAGQA
jgi:hypothetical protein